MYEVFIEPKVLEFMKNPDALSQQLVVFRHGGFVDGKKAIQFSMTPKGNTNLKPERNEINGKTKVEVFSGNLERAGELNNHINRFIEENEKCGYRVTSKTVHVVNTGNNCLISPELVITVWMGLPINMY